MGEMLSGCSDTNTISLAMICIANCRVHCIALRGETRALSGGEGGGEVNIHIFVFCPTNFF